jgi:hypothetical protein
MADEPLVTRLATAADVADIAALLLANEAPAGPLTGHFDAATVAAALADMPAIVARRGAALAGVVLLGSTTAAAAVPILAAMLAAYRGDADAYLYGPVCVAASERGRGVVERLVAAVKATLPDREGILFIRADNAASLHVHRDKLGMTVRGHFRFADADHLVLSYR